MPHTLKCHLSIAIIVLRSFRNATVFYAQIEKVGIVGAAPKYNSRVGGWEERGC